MAEEKNVKINNLWPLKGKFKILSIPKHFDSKLSYLFYCDAFTLLKVTLNRNGAFSLKKQ